MRPKPFLETFPAKYLRLVDARIRVWEWSSDPRPRSFEEGAIPFVNPLYSRNCASATTRFILTPPLALSRALPFSAQGNYGDRTAGFHARSAAAIGTGCRDRVTGEALISQIFMSLTNRKT
jgi:hypothetical protein